MYPAESAVHPEHARRGVPLYVNAELISFLEIVKLQTETAYNTLFGGISHTIYELFTFIHNL